MSKDISVIDTIQNQKEKDIARRGQPALDLEGQKVAEEKRYTILCYAERENDVGSGREVNEE